MSKKQFALALIEQLKEGIVTFTFIKKNGEERVANGTLCPSLFTYESKGSATSAPPDMLKYWDMDKGGWRSCRFDQLKIA